MVYFENENTKLIKIRISKNKCIKIFLLYFFNKKTGTEISLIPEI